MYADDVVWLHYAVLNIDSHALSLILTLFLMTAIYIGSSL